MSERFDLARTFAFDTYINTVAQVVEKYVVLKKKNYICVSDIVPLGGQSECREHDSVCRQHTVECFVRGKSMARFRRVVFFKRTRDGLQYIVVTIKICNNVLLLNRKNTFKVHRYLLLF